MALHDVGGAFWVDDGLGELVHLGNLSGAAVSPCGAADSGKLLSDDRSADIRRERVQPVIDSVNYLRDFCRGR